MEKYACKCPWDCVCVSPTGMLFLSLVLFCIFSLTHKYGTFPGDMSLCFSAAIFIFLSLPFYYFVLKQIDGICVLTVHLLMDLEQLATFPKCDHKYLYSSTPKISSTLKIVSSNISLITEIKVDQI